MIKETTRKKGRADANPSKAKPLIGVFGITGCAGCQLSIIFNEDDILDLIDLVDLRAFPFIKEVNPEEHFDICIIEGLVADKGDLERIKKLRGNSKMVVSLGACACTGCVPAYRQFTLKENYEHLLYQKMEEIQGEKKEIGWGHQIRSYVLHPYRLVKDLRTKVEIGNADAVLDGEIDTFIEAFLLKGAD